MQKCPLLLWDSTPPHLVKIIEVIRECHGLVRPQSLHGQDDSPVPRWGQVRYVPHSGLEDAVEEGLLRLEKNLK